MQDRPTTSWPPPYTGGGADDAATVVSSATPSAGAGQFPPANWPSRAQIDYAQAIIVLGLVVLALPWVISKLLTNPGVLLAGIGRRVPLR